MAVDWLTIRNDYINGGGSYRKLSEKYGVALRTIAKHAKDEEWQQQKAENLNMTAMAVQQKTIEKIAESESEIAAIRSRLRLRIMQQLENRLDHVVDGMEFRRLVQSYKDMCEITDGIGNTEENDDGFLDALNGTAGEDWSDESDIPV